VTKHDSWGHVIIWEFQVRAGMEKQFEEVYGPEGGWAKLFSRDAAYLGTELIRDLKAARRYVTLDYWSSEQAYDDFRNRYLGEYKALDKKCETLTEGEQEIGRFTPCGANTLVRGS
jgi:heme-degrading monooxygenase HmoA